MEAKDLSRHQQQVSRNKKQGEEALKDIPSERLLDHGVDFSLAG